MLVWSVSQRLLHWVLAGSVIGSFLTHERAGDWHFWLGYLALACAVLRVIAGLIAGQFWRFSNCVRDPKATLNYVRLLFARTEPRYIGHNPLGAWMILLLLATTIIASVSGWISITDKYWGVAWVGNIHEISGHAFIPLIVMHFMGGMYSSWRHRENLIWAMIAGKKNVTGSSDSQGISKK